MINNAIAAAVSATSHGAAQHASASSTPPSSATPELDAETVASPQLSATASQRSPSATRPSTAGPTPSEPTPPPSAAASPPLLCSPSPASLPPSPPQLAPSSPAAPPQLSLPSPATQPQLQLPLSALGPLTCLPFPELSLPEPAAPPQALLFDLRRHSPVGAPLAFPPHEAATPSLAAAALAGHAADWASIWRKQLSVQPELVDGPSQPRPRYDWSVGPLPPLPLRPPPLRPESHVPSPFDAREEMWDALRSHPLNVQIKNREPRA